ncbi:hypothetical protein [Streptomyces roseochromogenus]|uniref:Uncharacterized protein n=1 Tax=Streptomyces roseochromogenus subsp. oscitans DS 12.976 TaxID=1352936 RepID=V6K8G2_STRRC|nr:hypothetical protein [Streptomyces roseochromogenus]EST28460.1 hypothetical protein M878_22565 [Streptomyces roseochromogenus subsp. oscitans DS 12.976]
MLHPLQHDLFWFTGVTLLDPFVVYDSVDVPRERFAAAKWEYGRGAAGSSQLVQMPVRSRLDIRIRPRG